MSFENKTLGELLSDERIRRIAPDAIRGRDMSEEDVWNMTLSQLKHEHFFSGEIAKGLERLYAAADTGEWYYPLYEDEKRANIVWLPSNEPGADDRPFILLVPGGGFVNVWSLTEGWPIAEQYNRLGYHVFVLTYLVDGEEKLLDKDMEDMASALRFIREHRDKFHVQADSYITCGFSAGGYLVCLWNTEKGYPYFDLPKPRACFPVYPVTTLKEGIRYGDTDPEEALRLYGCSVKEAAATSFEITEHAEGFPPCALFVTEEDELVNPENSKLLARVLEKLGIPCRLEVGLKGGHGFADGSGMCMAGWTTRAIRWYEQEDR